MPNIAAVLKTVIARLSSKEIRSQTQALQEASSEQRAAQTDRWPEAADRRAC
jgi:hypothetical protein